MAINATELSIISELVQSAQLKFGSVDCWHSDIQIF